MKKVIALAIAASGLALLANAPVGASELCYDINVQVLDQAPIAQAGCQDIPDLPEAP